MNRVLAVAVLLLGVLKVRPRRFPLRRFLRRRVTGFLEFLPMRPYPRQAPNDTSTWQFGFAWTDDSGPLTGNTQFLFAGDQDQNAGPFIWSQVGPYGTT
jgi:hypothetical protein